MTVAVAPQPDLTAGIPSPSSTTYGTSWNQTATTLTGVVSNSTLSTGSGFTSIFQIDAPHDSNPNNDIFRTDTSPALAAGGTDTISTSYVFPEGSGSAYTAWVRICADNNAAWASSITESNEGNNCGSWRSMTVSPPAPTGTLTCTVSNTNPTPGTSVTYTANPANGATGPYTWNDSQGGSYGTASIANRYIPTTGPYTMTVTGTNAINPANCPLINGGCANPTATISASPDRILKGDSTTISWTASGITSSCVISGTNGYSNTVVANMCAVPNGSVDQTLTDQTIFTIDCDSGDATAQVIVNVVPRFIEF